MEYKPEQLNVVADALLRRPDFDPVVQSDGEVNLTVATLSVRVPSSSFLDKLRKEYAEDKSLFLVRWDI